MRTTQRFATCILVLAASLAGCGGDDSPDGPNDSNTGTGGKSGGESGKSGGESGKSGGESGTSGKQATEPVTGETEFVSADRSGNGTGNNRGGLDAAAEGAGGQTGAVPAADNGFANAGAERTVERGDIFRVLDDHRILNLNGYRGLQVIDISDLNAPRVEGRLAASGTPVEMYVAGDRALVLLNNWSGYYGSRDDVAVEQRQGGLVIVADISDRANPKLLDQEVVPGSISTSRLTQGDGKAALYVASNGYWDETDQSNHTYVKSFDVSGDSLVPKSELDLGGYVVDIQATVDVLLVAAQDWTSNTQSSTVTLIDISRPDGAMVKGGTITAAGMVQNKFNMDVYEGVLRVVSGSNWSGTQTNHLQTFDVGDLSKPALLDECTFGGSEQLKGTIFMQERAFFVTFFQTDPFHSFTIDAQGQCEEHNEFIVSGWNDFLRPALGDTRIIGIGTNTDVNGVRGNAVSVSLYDATDVKNPNPLLARADVDTTEYSYSEAQYDDRAFSVIEGAVSIAAEDGTTETGLILLPFQGYDNQGQRYVAQVQLLTFSDSTLTLRGTMDHGSAVRRSFPTDAATTANLSEEQLSLFNTTNPDAPKELGRVDVAPNYSELFVFGDHVARVKNRSMYFTWNSQMSVAPPKSVIDVLARSSNLDTTTPIATFEVPADAKLVQVGNLLVSISTTQTYDANKPIMSQEDIHYESTLGVYDLSDPAHPQLRGSLETDRLRPGYYGYYYLDLPVADCFGGCGWGGRGGYWGGYGSQIDHHVVGKAIAFPIAKQEQESLGMMHTCSWYSNESAPCATSSDGTTTCKGTFVNGGITCNTPEGGKEFCSGHFERCDYETGECDPIEKPSSAMSYCQDYENIRYWNSYSVEALDLRNPDAPALITAAKFAKDEEGSSLVAEGTDLFFNFQKPYEIAGDPRPHVKRFFRAVDLGDPAHPTVGAAINIPGDVIARDGDTIYTRDIVWDTDATTTLVARLTLADDRAHLQASHLFQDQSVQAVVLDGAGHVLVSADPVWYYYRNGNNNEQPKHNLFILDAASLKTAGMVEVDNWATFTSAKGGRALYQVGSGLLVFNVKDATKPTAQAYFPTLGWPRGVYFDGSEILFAAGPYGVYRFDADVFNLLD